MCSKWLRDGGFLFNLNFRGALYYDISLSGIMIGWQELVRMLLVWEAEIMRIMVPGQLKQKK
jgi:hypothetical protein